MKKGDKVLINWGNLDGPLGIGRGMARCEVVLVRKVEGCIWSANRKIEIQPCSGPNVVIWLSKCSRTCFTIPVRPRASETKSFTMLRAGEMGVK